MLIARLEQTLCFLFYIDEAFANKLVIRLVEIWLCEGRLGVPLGKGDSDYIWAFQIISCDKCERKWLVFYTHLVTLWLNLDLFNVWEESRSRLNTFPLEVNNSPVLVQRFKLESVCGCGWPWRQISRNCKLEERRDVSVKAVGCHLKSAVVKILVRAFHRHQIGRLFLKNAPKVLDKYLRGLGE